MEEKLLGVLRRDRGQNLRVPGDGRQTQQGDDHKPDNHDGTE
jgi:hypothetical protein